MHKEKYKLMKVEKRTREKKNHATTTTEINTFLWFILDISFISFVQFIFQIADEVEIAMKQLPLRFNNSEIKWCMADAKESTKKKKNYKCYFEFQVPVGLYLDLWHWSTWNCQHYICIVVECIFHSIRIW